MKGKLNFQCLYNKLHKNLRFLEELVNVAKQAEDEERRASKKKLLNCGFAEI